MAPLKICRKNSFEAHSSEAVYKHHFKFEISKISEISQKGITEPIPRPIPRLFAGFAFKIWRVCDIGLSFAQNNLGSRYSGDSPLGSGFSHISHQEPIITPLIGSRISPRYSGASQRRSTNHVMHRVLYYTHRNSTQLASLSIPFFHYIGFDCQLKFSIPSW